MREENPRLLDCNINGGGLGFGNINGTEGAVHDDLEGKNEEEDGFFGNDRNEESSTGSLLPWPGFMVLEGVSSSKSSVGDVGNGLLKVLNRVLKRFSKARRFPAPDCEEGSGIRETSELGAKRCFSASCLHVN